MGRTADLTVLIDLLSPIGKGQRGYDRFPSKTGKTTLLKQIAKCAQCSLQDENISPIGYLEKISIKRNYQNKGIAKKLLNKCEDWAKDRGCEKFTASCNIDDEQAMNLYNYSGFSEISKVAYFSKELNI